MIHFDKDVLNSPNRNFSNKDYHRYVGFSGGSDSLAGFLFLKEGGWNVTALHIQHFGSPASVLIKGEVIGLSHKLGFDLEVITPGIHGHNFLGKDINEANAHAIRSKVINSLSSQVILCNHLNDLAEGYFMNCMQGNGDRVPLLAVNGNKLRPFIRTRKEDFTDFLAKRGLTNLIVPDSMISLRGKLREQVFPALGNDWTAPARRLFIDSRRIYGRN